MSAPDSSNSKAPPSLLADTAKGSQANGSRILANLEGRVAPPAATPRRSRAPFVLVALLVAVAGGWGAWHLQQRTQDGHAGVAAAPEPDAAQHAGTATAASAAPQVTAKAALPDAASASQAATIVADDNASKDARSSVNAAASAPGGGDDSRLARALANGADMSAASAAPGDAGKTAKPAAEASSHARHERETVSSRSRHASATAVAQAKKDRQRTVAHNGAGKSKDDPDADLLAALVARTKPADSKAGANADGTTKVSASTGPGNARLAERVKECDTRGFFEDQLCRWRVCDGHWGKDPACPGAAPQPKQQ